MAMHSLSTLKKYQNHIYITSHHLPKFNLSLVFCFFNFLPPRPSVVGDPFVRGMESTDREAFSYTTLPPFPFLSDFSLVESKGDLKSLQGANFHQRSSSESFLIEEEQPAWLDDLLNDSETFFHKGHHRRSASDSYAYLGESMGKLNIREESKYISTFGGASAKSQNPGAQKHNQVHSGSSI